IAARALLPPVAVLTVLNLSADAFLAYAVTRGDLAVVAVLASLAPVVTALLAHPLTAERPPERRGPPWPCSAPWSCPPPRRSPSGTVERPHRLRRHPMTKLEEGAKAPAFTLPDQDGTPVSLADFKGQRVLLYFYPADDTPGCTREACQFNDNLAHFQTAGVPVMGISRDDAQSHQRFRNKYGLQFPLLTDADHQVMDAYGAWGEKTRYGQTSIGVLRSTFLVDEQGRIERAWHNVKADGHAAKVLEALGPKV